MIRDEDFGAMYELRAPESWDGKMSGFTSLISASTALCSALKGLIILEGKTILAISREDKPSSACWIIKSFCSDVNSMTSAGILPVVLNSIEFST